jgi:hypothetical protein
MLIESSMTSARAIDAPDARCSDSCEHLTKGVAPSSASVTTDAARVEKRALSSSCERRRARGGAGGTKRTGAKDWSSARRRRRRCARYGTITHAVTASASTDTNVISAPRGRRRG